MTEKPVCGVLYRKLLDYATLQSVSLNFSSSTADLPNLLEDYGFKAFTIGFIGGQAEKVYLGSCMAAMFRPSDAHIGMVCSILRHVTGIYQGVVWMRDPYAKEVWLYLEPYSALIKEVIRHSKLIQDEEASEEEVRHYHEIRARLCGVSSHQIDREFHLRKGYGEPCDILKGEE